LTALSTILNVVHEASAQLTRRDSPARPPTGRTDARGVVADSAAERLVSRRERGSRPAQPTFALGSRLRVERHRVGLSARELARRLRVSPSLVSQIETGKIQPSVRTLYAMVNALGVSVDELFAPPARPGSIGSVEGGVGSAAASAGVERRREARHVQRRDSRRVIELNSGVRWEWLTAADQGAVEFVEAIYGVGGASSPDGKLVRHSGREFGLVLSGRLHVTVGSGQCVLEAGDSISFSSNIPHRLLNDGNEIVEAIWVVVDR
jgi:transcriptional regulator with XRE-family HTH domain